MTLARHESACSDLRYCQRVENCGRGQRVGDRGSVHAGENRRNELRDEARKSYGKSYVRRAPKPVPAP
jgi:hypothetical protein